MNVSSKLHFGLLPSQVSWWRASASTLAALLLWVVSSDVVSAQRLEPELLEQFLSDPLTDEPRDPALPQPIIERDLSPLELYQLDITLDELDAQAQALLEADEPVEPPTDDKPFEDDPVEDDPVEPPRAEDAPTTEDDLPDDPPDAFDLWLREVRLRRVLGREAELSALERVVPLFWNNQRGTEIQLLTQRLRSIWNETTTQSQTDEAKLERLLDLFVILRDEDAVITITQGLADQAAAQGDGTTQRQRLADLGEAYLEWFEFDQAAAVYAPLVADAASRDRPELERALLEQLIYSYQQSGSYAEAIPHQQRLLGLYREAALSESEVPLEIAIARNYRALADYSRAVEYYQLAYRTAQQLQQYGYSSDVLKDLGALYRELGQLRDAVTMYNLLVQVEQQSYNHYGILLAYEQLGQIYVELDEPDNARVALEAGLAFAEALDYRQADFLAQLAALE